MFTHPGRLEVMGEERRHMSDTGPKNDPAPWRHVDGTRVGDGGQDGAPQGGYTYSPRMGYDDYPDRYVSTRWPELNERRYELPLLSCTEVPGE